MGVVVEERYIVSGNIITSVAFNFTRFAVGFGNMLGLKTWPGMFGIRE